MIFSCPSLCFSRNNDFPKPFVGTCFACVSGQEDIGNRDCYAVDMTGGSIDMALSVNKLKSVINHI